MTNRRAVGLLNPMRDKIEGKNRGGGEETPETTTFFFFFFFDPPGDPGKKKLKLHTLSFVYQFSSICRTQTLCQPPPSGLVKTMNLPAFFG